MKTKTLNVATMTCETLTTDDLKTIAGGNFLTDFVDWFVLKTSNFVCGMQ